MTINLYEFEQIHARPAQAFAPLQARLDSAFQTSGLAHGIHNIAKSLGHTEIRASSGKDSARLEGSIYTDKPSGLTFTSYGARLLKRDARMSIYCLTSAEIARLQRQKNAIPRNRNEEYDKLTASTALDKAASKLNNPHNYDLLMRRVKVTGPDGIKIIEGQVFRKDPVQIEGANRLTILFSDLGYCLYSADMRALRETLPIIADLNEKGRRHSSSAKPANN